MALESYLQLFESRTKKSKELYEDVKNYLPGGVCGGAGWLKPHPVYVAKAMGSKLYDIDGNEYIDMMMGGSPNILGHSPECIVQAVSKILDFGTVSILCNEHAPELATKIRQRMPHMEMLRIVNTGSEAVMFALRVARSYTKKDKIAKVEGGYNGQYDYVLITGAGAKGIGPADRPASTFDCCGIPKSVLDNVIVYPWNNIEASVAIIKEHAEELAAVIMEPIGGFGLGGCPAEKEFMKAIREVTKENNVLLIWDEVITGFRLGGLGGCAGYYGVKPDLSAIGKIVGGGFPVGAYGGRRDIMEKVVSPLADPEYRIFQSGTFTANPITVAAGLAMLKFIETNDVYSHIDGLGEKVRAGLSKLASDLGVDMQVTGMGSLYFPHFNSEVIRNKRDQLKDDLAKNYEFCMGMIANGVFHPPNHMGFISYAHTEEEINYILNLAEKLLKEMKQ